MQRALSHLYDLGIDFTLVYNVIQGKGKIISERGLGTRDTGFYYFRYGDGAVKLTKPKGVPWNLGCKWLCSIGFVFTKVYGCGDAQSCEVQNALFWAPGPGKDARFLERAPWLQKALRLFPWGEKAERDLSEANDARKVEAAAAAGAKGAGVASDMTGRSVDELLSLGAEPDRNGLTVAGRALQKHGDRAGSAFPRSFGTAAERNAQGQRVLGEILHNASSVKNRGGGVFDVYDRMGRGARFNKTSFVGFREP